MEIPQAVKGVLERLEAAGFAAWCVGGCVRDALLGRRPEDWDVAASALPEETLALFGENALPTGLKHGTVSVKSAGQTVEVTTFRRDGTYQDHRRPDFVVFTSSLEEDLRRRDFTVNAMAVDLRGTLRDPFGGREDLAAGVLRCVGDPVRRLQEDALRIMRGLRFGAALGFRLEEETAAAIRRERELLEEIAPERIWQELWKLLPGRDAPEVFRQFPEVFGVFWPELLPMIGFDQQNIHHCYDVWEHTLHALDASPRDPLIRCAVLLHDIGKPQCFTVDGQGVGHFYGHPKKSAAMAEEMLRRLRCGNETRETIIRLVAWHDREIARTDKAVRRALGALGETDLKRLFSIKRADSQARDAAYRGDLKEIRQAEEILDDLLAKDACFSLRQLAVKGDDLLELGLSGPPVGLTLAALLDQVIDGTLPNDRASLLEWVQNSR